MNDQQIEAEIQSKGLNAPRITLADIESNIKEEYFFTAGDGYAGAFAVSGELSNAPENEDGIPLISVPESLDLLTFCVLVLRNGFTVAGESACASPENFDEEIGRKIARHNAVQKIWPLRGYSLKDKLMIK